MTVLANGVGDMNMQARQIIDEEAWPPELPDIFTPLVLIHYQGIRNFEQSAAMAEFVGRGCINDVMTKSSNNVASKYHEPLQEALDASTVTEKVSDILISFETSSDPQFILIEGAPGMGKSLLLKEIAYRWSIRQILHKIKLVLLVCLRDPAVQEMTMINHLLQSFCIRDMRAAKAAAVCSDYLLGNRGKDIIFLFDGYDEYPEALQKKSLIADIIKRRVLPHCGLIISSRQHASRNLHKQATVKVDILGFTEAGREHYIKTTMKDYPQKVKEITQYLQQHSTISSLCFVPFNMAVLLYLYKQGISLPKNATELYNLFICLTICRHLAKSGDKLEKEITDLTNLPEPCGKIIQQLSKFSLQAIDNNNLIFTLDDIKEACPDIATIPGAINGFGLLQALQHFCITGKKITLNFVHFSVQEFLAAYYITTLQPSEELEVIKEKFWSELHFNMFSMYIALTKGQQSSFKNFLSDGDRAIPISSKFLDDQIKCFRLYHCFHEAGDTVMCNAIEQSEIFKEQMINLRHTRLTTSEVECAAIFLHSSSHKTWKELQLSYCYIQDHGLTILHRRLRQSDITIVELSLDSNELTKLSSPLVSEITIHCKVKELKINGNSTIGEDERLFLILTDPSSVLKVLSMNHIKLSQATTTNLFVALKDNNTLKRLDIEDASITDDVCDVITAALEGNNCLAELSMRDNNSITGKGIKSIVQALKSNSTLEWLFLPSCPEEIEKIVNSQQKVINKQREKQRCKAKIRIFCS